MWSSEWVLLNSSSFYFSKKIKGEEMKMNPLEVRPCIFIWLLRNHCKSIEMKLKGLESCVSWKVFSWSSAALSAFWVLFFVLNTLLFSLFCSVTVALLQSAFWVLLDSFLVQMIVLGWGENAGERMNENGSSCLLHFLMNWTFMPLFDCWENKVKESKHWLVSCYFNLLQKLGQVNWFISEGIVDRKVYITF